MSAAGSLVSAVLWLLVLAWVAAQVSDRLVDSSLSARLSGRLTSPVWGLAEHHALAPAVGFIGIGVALWVIGAGLGTALALFIGFVSVGYGVWIGAIAGLSGFVSPRAYRRAASDGYPLPMNVDLSRDVGFIERWGGWLRVPDSGSILALGASESGKTSACEHVVAPMIDETATENGDSGTPVVLYDHKEDYQTHLATYHPHRPAIRLSSEGSTHTWSVFAELEAAESRGDSDADADRMADRLAQALFSETETGAGGSSRYFARASRQVFAAVVKYLYRDARENDRTPGNGVLVRFFQTRDADEAAAALAEHVDLRPATTHLKGDGQAAGVWSSVQLEVLDTFAGDLAGDPTESRPAFSVTAYMHDPGGRALVLDYRGDEPTKKVFTTLVTLASRPAIDAGTGGRFVLDEIEKLNHRIPTLEELLNVGSQRGVRVLVTLQSVAQLRAVYGKERATSLLAGFLTTLIMRVNDADSVEFAKARIGPDRIERTSHVERGNVDGHSYVKNRETRLEEEDVFGDRELRSWPVGVGCLIRKGSLAAGYIPLLSAVRPSAPREESVSERSEPEATASTEPGEAEATAD